MDLNACCLQLLSFSHFHPLPRSFVGHRGYYIFNNGKIWVFTAKITAAADDAAAAAVVVVVSFFFLLP